MTSLLEDNSLEQIQKNFSLQQYDVPACLVTCYVTIKTKSFESKLCKLKYIKQYIVQRVLLSGVTVWKCNFVSYVESYFCLQTM